MNKIVLIASLLFSTYLVMGQEFINYTTEIDGTDRNYFVYVPDGLDPGTMHPLVLNLHGLGSNGTEQMFYSGFNAVADAEGFILAYPDGLEATVQGVSSSHWNASFGTGVDDVAFMDKLITEVSQNHDIDPARVYSTGMSNGGYMSYTLACTLSDRIAAIASVTGAMLILQQQNCDIDYVPGIMQIHGTSDGTVPFEGTPFIQNSIPNIVGYWVNKLNCQTGPDSIEFADIVTDDLSTVLSQSYTDCDDDNEVLFYTVFNGGHSWPGAFSVPGLGNTNQDIEASEHIWEFFERHVHPNPSVISSTESVLANEVILIIPNPVANRFLISHTEVNSSYEIFDLLGHLMGYGIYSGSGVDVGQLEPGIYFLRLDGKTPVQFIKQ